MQSEPKSVRFRYDLFLHKENMPPVNHTRIEMLTFTNPADDFRKRLIKGGGIKLFEIVFYVGYLLTMFSITSLLPD